jgi:DNA-binding MarR family transcriptional regulator
MTVALSNIDNMLSIVQTAFVTHPLEELVDEVLRTSGRLVAATATTAAGGLSGAQLLVLSSVVRAERPPTVPQIGRSLGHSRQAVQRLVDGLCARGLIKAVDNPDHKRARRLVPTRLGKAAHAQADRRSRTWAARVTQGLTAAEIGSAAATLRKLRHRLESDSAATA